MVVKFSLEGNLQCFKSQQNEKGSLIRPLKALKNLHTHTYSLHANLLIRLYYFVELYSFWACCLKHI